MARRPRPELPAPDHRGIIVLPPALPRPPRKQRRNRTGRGPQVPDGVGVTLTKGTGETTNYQRRRDSRLETAGNGADDVRRRLTASYAEAIAAYDSRLPDVGAPARRAKRPPVPPAYDRI